MLPQKRNHRKDFVSEETFRKKLEEFKGLIPVDYDRNIINFLLSVKMNLRYAGSGTRLLRAVHKSILLNKSLLEIKTYIYSELKKEKKEYRDELFREEKVKLKIKKSSTIKATSNTKKKTAGKKSVRKGTKKKYKGQFIKIISVPMGGQNKYKRK